MVKAKQLIEESGTKGQKVTLIGDDKAVPKVHRHLYAERAARPRLRCQT